MSQNKPRSKTLQKMRNIFRNNVSDLNKYRVASAFFGKPQITPWWVKPKKKSVIKRKSEVKSKK